MQPRVLIGGSLFLFLTGALLSTGAEQASPAEGAKFFESQIQPLLQTHCVNCHGGDKTRSGLNLTTRQGLLKGGERGPAVSLDQPDASLLLQAVHHKDELKMPPKGKLSEAQLDALTRWLKMGAPWPEGAVLVQRSGPPPVDEQARSFWSFRPVARPKVPALKKADW